MTEAPDGGPILVFDSGVGGLTVFAQIAMAMPGADLVYAADTEGFPYGPLSADTVAARVEAVMARLIPDLSPSLVVIACNTASTLALPALRARYAVSFVGTVPAIKPAAERTRSGLVSVLATPGTVARDYTKDLIRSFAGACAVTLVGAPRLAEIAEAKLTGGRIDRKVIAAEIAAAFVERAGIRTDMVVLACTHYPLLLDDLAAAAPWPVTWIDPSPAIARRVAHLVGERPAPSGTGIRRAIVTGPPRDPAGLAAALARFGLPTPSITPVPFPGRTPI